MNDIILAMQQALLGHKVANVTLYAEGQSRIDILLENGETMQLHAKEFVDVVWMPKDNGG